MEMKVYTTFWPESKRKNERAREGMKRGRWRRLNPVRIASELSLGAVGYGLVVVQVRQGVGGVFTVTGESGVVVRALYCQLHTTTDDCNNSLGRKSRSLRRPGSE